MVPVSGSACSTTICAKTWLSLQRWSVWRGFICAKTWFSFQGWSVRGGLVIAAPSINHVSRAPANLILLCVKPGAGSVLGCVVAESTHVVFLSCSPHHNTPCSLCSGQLFPAHDTTLELKAWHAGQRCSQTGHHNGKATVCLAGLLLSNSQKHVSVRQHSNTYSFLSPLQTPP